MTKQPSDDQSNDMLSDLLAHREATYEADGRVKESLLKRCALCFGSAAGGGLLAHVGCISIPLAGVFGSSVGTLGPVVGATLSMVGLGTWFALAGHKQSFTKQSLVAAFAVAGTIAVAANHMVNADHEARSPESFIFQSCLQTGLSPESCARIC